MTYVQIGSGTDVGQGWINLDGSPVLRIRDVPLIGRGLLRIIGKDKVFPDEVRYGDVVRGLSFADKSVSGVYASHVLEHLSLDDMRAALREVLRVLRPGGAFRVIVPDLSARVRYYVERPGDPEAAHELIRACALGREQSRVTLMSRLKEAFGNSDHLWMYDHPSMMAELENAGFRDVRPARHGDCRDAMFSKVERAGRFDYGPDPEVAVEAVAP